jgi:hypothetical protein
MSVTVLDTHEVVKTLTAAGFTEQQAEAVTRIVRDSQNLDLSHLATKSDLAELRTELRAEFKTALAETKVDLIKWGIGIAFAQAGFAVAALRFIR